MNQYWFVGCTRSCQEMNVQKSLLAMGIECYVPAQRELREWSDRKVIKYRIVIPRTVFLYCNDDTRREALGTIAYLTHCRMDSMTHAPMKVPEDQLDVFRRVVARADSAVQFHLCSTASFRSGDRVKVLRGPLEGLECEIASVLNKTMLCLKLGMLGIATVQINSSDVQKMEN